MKNVIKDLAASSAVPWGTIAEKIDENFSELENSKSGNGGQSSKGVELIFTEKEIESLVSYIELSDADAGYMSLKSTQIPKVLFETVMGMTEEQLADVSAILLGLYKMDIAFTRYEGEGFAKVGSVVTDDITTYAMFRRSGDYYKLEITLTEGGRLLNRVNITEETLNTLQGYLQTDGDGNYLLFNDVPSSIFRNALKLSPTQSIPDIDVIHIESSFNLWSYGSGRWEIQSDGFIATLDIKYNSGTDSYDMAITLSEEGETVSPPSIIDLQSGYGTVISPGYIAPSDVNIAALSPDNPLQYIRSDYRNQNLLDPNITARLVCSGNKNMSEHYIGSAEYYSRGKLLKAIYHIDPNSHCLGIVDYVIKDLHIRKDKFASTEGGNWGEFSELENGWEYSQTKGNGWVLLGVPEKGFLKGVKRVFVASYIDSYYNVVEEIELSGQYHQNEGVFQSIIGNKKYELVIDGDSFNYTITYTESTVCNGLLDITVDSNISLDDIDTNITTITPIMNEDVWKYISDELVSNGDVPNDCTGFRLKDSSGTVLMSESYCYNGSELAVFFRKMNGETIKLTIIDKNFTIQKI